MTRGAKIVVFSVVGLFLLAGIYFGFVAPPANTGGEPDAFATGTPSGSLGDAGSLTLTPAPVVDPLASPTTAPAAPANTTGFPIASGGVSSPTPAGVPMGAVTTSPTATLPAPTGTLAATPAPAPANTLTTTPTGIVNAPAPLPTTVATAPTAPAKPAVVPPVTKKPATNYTTYTVKAGDTLSGIAGEWFKDVDKWQAIVDVNPGLKPSALKVGQKINLPARSTQVAAKPAAKAVAAADNVPVKAPTGSATSQHVVVEGETLASISDKFYGTRNSWKRIYEANKGVIGSNPSALKIGMKLTIPAKS